jgi:hypothetical protein
MITLAQRGQGDLYLDRMLLVVIADRQVQAPQQLALKRSRGSLTSAF